MQCWSTSRARWRKLFRDLRSSPAGLGSREAATRLLIYGPNELTRHSARRWPGELLAQFTQPLALLLAIAAALAWVGGTPALSVAVVAVIVLNAAFAFVQEMQAERAVEAFAAFLLTSARALRDGVRTQVATRDWFPVMSLSSPRATGCPLTPGSWTAVFSWTCRR